MGEDEEIENGRNGEWRGGPHGGGFHHSEPVAAAASGGGSRQQQQQQQQPISQILSCCDDTVMNSEKMRSVELPCYNKSPPIPRDRSGVSIAERRARLGFDASKINTARFRTTSPLTSPSARSPFITIPPGLSPTSLLDSPVMLHNSQAQPSPTTGTYPLPFPCHKSSVPISASEMERCNDIESSSMFKPHANPIPMQCFPGPESQAKDLVMTDVNSQVMAALQPQVEYDSSAGFWKQTMPKFYNSSPLNFDASNNVNSKFIPLQASQSSDASYKTPQYEEQVHGEDLVSRQLLEGDQKGAYISAGMGRPSEDGYNWRKYGQKQVKGSEYPRSYYKCTSPNCPVKKKIERSRDGQITEIIIDGSHNHPKPQPSRRSAMGSAFAQTEISETGDAPGLHDNSEGGPVWRGLPQESIHNKVGSDWRTDGLERTSSTSVVTDLSDQLSTAQAKHLGILESADTPELSSTLASHDEDEDRATQGSVSVGDDADDVESEAKRRKKDSCLMETSLASRAVREPRVVVQTDSEVDILDDGYRWRKYGQKVVKGNPNPRSYYKCTSAGCTVRKHVERASHDLKFVITTYEGKHNHEVPAARNNSHSNSSGGNASASNPNAQTSLSLPRTASIPKPEAHVQDLVPRFERKPEFSNDFFRPNNLGGYASDMKYGAPAYYGMKLPPFQPTMPCGPFGLNQNPNEVHRVAPIAQGLPDFPMSLPLNFPLPPNLDFGSYNFNSHGKPVVSAQSYLGAQQAKEEDMKIIRPKQELKDDAGFETNNLYNAGFTL